MRRVLGFLFLFCKFATFFLSFIILLLPWVEDGQCERDSWRRRSFCKCKGNRWERHASVSSHLSYGYPFPPHIRSSGMVSISFNVAPPSHTAHYLFDANPHPPHICFPSNLDVLFGLWFVHLIIYYWMWPFCYLFSRGLSVFINWQEFPFPCIGSGGSATKTWWDACSKLFLDGDNFRVWRCVPRSRNSNSDYLELWWKGSSCGGIVG